MEKYKKGVYLKYEKFYAKSIYLYWLSANIKIFKFVSAREPFISISHSHSMMELCYVTSGYGRMWVEKIGYIRLKKRDLLYLAPGVSHYLISDSDEPMQICIIAFTIYPCTTKDKVPASWIEDERRLLKNLENNKIILAKDNFCCYKELQNIERIMEFSYRGEFVKLKSHISNFLINAFMAFDCDYQQSDFMANFNNSTVSIPNILDYMREHFSEGITLTSMAEALNYSPRQCQRLISDFMGISFSELLMNIKMSHAKELLRNTKKTLEEIAEYSGFSSGKAFAKQFKKKEGITPTQYRKNNN